MITRIFLLFLAICSLFPLESFAQNQSTVLWAWQRPEDLRFLSSQEEVAFLWATLFLEEGTTRREARAQPLFVPPTTRLLAVVRVEAGNARHPSYSTAQRDAIIAELVRASTLPRVYGVQLDFDSTRSERAFHRDVLAQARARLPRSVFFSMTALASWCMYDRWLHDVPTDEIVPMLFEMGPDGPATLRSLQQERDFPETRCRQAFGISVDTAASVPWTTPRRRYLFSRLRWTRNRYERVAPREASTPSP